MSSSTTVSSQRPETERVPFAKIGVIAGLTLLTAAACFIGQAPSSKSEAGISLDLPDSIGKFWGTRQEVTEAEKFILPKDTEFAKKLYSDGGADNINCQIVLAGGEKRSIHRPEVCLPGQGWTLKSGEVVRVPLENGKPLDVMKLTIARPITTKNGETRELTSLFYYWFVGKGTTTPYHFVRVLKTNLDMLLHNTNHRWAYVIVSAAVTQGFERDGKSTEETQEMLEKFIGEMAPKIMEPDDFAGDKQASR